uniref:Uncharacterized protein n=1 Tax=Meloidogyne floridensis TaxID=298350 RepID=A0A915P6W0_9BILA
MPRSWFSNFCQRPLASRRFLLCLVALLSILAILLIISLVFVLLSVRWPNGEENDDVDFLNKHSSWQYSCDHKCNANFSVPPLLIISMDGFRADYLKRGITHSVSRILECGSSAQYMLPSFPSKTFPNHFTIVTGLYPESHGIVDNHFYDEYMPNEKNFAKSSRNPAWYNGEPIWNTVAKNGKKSAVFFWPGSEVAIQGILPTYRFAYDSSKPFFTRARQVIDWLQLEESERPSFLAMYFEQPDTAMHREGPDSDAVNSALIYVDAMINYLMHQLDDNLRSDNFFSLDKYVNAKDPQVGGVFGGTIGHINFRDSTNSSYIDQVLAPMTCLGGQKFRVYTRYTMPMRYHYTRSSRIGEIVIDSTAGGRVFVDQKSLKEHGPMEKGDHGYDNRMREMRAIFGAWGPSIKNGYQIETFQNIELYNLFTGGGY